MPSPSPIKQNINNNIDNSQFTINPPAVNIEMNSSSIIENRTKYLDNFMKNKEMLNRNMKKEFSSELKFNHSEGGISGAAGGSINSAAAAGSSSSSNSNINPFDKLAEMRRKLEILKSQK
jgi:hypothetical protein